MDQRRRQRSPHKPEHSPGAGEAGGEAAPLRWSRLHQGHHRAGELATHREALQQAQQHQQHGGAIPPRTGGRQQGNAQAAGCHHRHAYQQQRPAPHQIPDRPQQQPADRPHQIAHREHGEGTQQLQRWHIRREEGLADLLGEVAVHGEVEPLHRVADGAGQGAARDQGSHGA